MILWGADLGITRWFGGYDARCRGKPCSYDPLLTLAWGGFAKPMRSFQGNPRSSGLGGEFENEGVAILSPPVLHAGGQFLDQVPAVTAFGQVCG